LAPIARPDSLWRLEAGGIVAAARFIPSPNQDERPLGVAVRLLVVHAISLPPGEYGGDAVERLFTNRLDPLEHPYYAEIADLRVSAHFFIRRGGELVQFVPVDRRAWHAGASCWRGLERCNDFSVGVELEGCDWEPFEPAQYACLNRLTALLARFLPLEAVAGHSDIAPGRKTDPGPHFDWSRYAAAAPLIQRA
jgi:AmpD protein